MPRTADISFAEASKLLKASTAGLFEVARKQDWKALLGAALDFAKAERDARAAKARENELNLDDFIPAQPPVPHK